MKILESMLRQWIAVPDDIVSLTNQKIIEVEAFDPVNPATKLVIGHVLTCEPHPNADKLFVTTVDMGDCVEQIVCGAANVAAGQYVIAAQVGTVLPGDFEIKAVKIRGVESRGMICSLEELGFDDEDIPASYRGGIFYFDTPQTIGAPALPAIGQQGFVMTLGLTPNRADLLSVLGYAYDVAAMTNQSIRLPKFTIKENGPDNPVKVEIKTKGCSHYYARYFRDVKIADSPLWLKSALLACGIQPINNVVDISNYVLLEYGTPLHMFDAKKVKTDTIVVRDAKAGETVTSLDEEERVLEKGDVVITDGKTPIAIGGVMGLLNTIIDQQTDTVILEAACFNPKQIMKTSKRLDLRSESSLRFERGVDEERVIMGLERATELLVELTGATVYKGIASAVREARKRPKITFQKTYPYDALGIHLTEDEVVSYLRRYNYDITIKSDHYSVIPPSYRNDITIDADVLEEIARIHGLNNIPTTPLQSIASGRLTTRQQRLRGIRHVMAAIGLNEIISYSLLAPSDVHRYRKLGEPVSVLAPLSEDKKTLRQSLLHGLLEAVRYNQARQHDDVAVFEIGHLFAKDVESTWIGAAISGRWHHHPWNKDAIHVDFFLMKGLIDRLLDPLGIHVDYVKGVQHDRFHPHKQADIRYKGHTIGRIAELHPLEANRLDIKNTVVFELHLEPLLDRQADLTYQPVSRYPHIERDLAVVVDDDVAAGDLMTLIRQTAKKRLVSLTVFDVYKGGTIESGRKSIAFRLVFNDASKTMDAAEADKLIAQISTRLTTAHHATIRR